MKVVENLLRKADVETLNYWKTYVVDTHWNCLYEAIPMCTNNIYVTENRETIILVKDKWEFNEGRKYCRMLSLGPFCKTFDLH